MFSNFNRGKGLLFFFSFSKGAFTPKHHGCLIQRPNGIAIFMRSFQRVVEASAQKGRKPAIILDYNTNKAGMDDERKDQPAGLL